MKKVRVQWECVICGVGTKTDNTGIPKGWATNKKSQICPECVRQMKRHKQLIKEILNLKDK